MSNVDCKRRKSMLFQRRFRHQNTSVLDLWIVTHCLYISTLNRYKKYHLTWKQRLWNFKNTLLINDKYNSELQGREKHFRSFFCVWLMLVSFIRLLFLKEEFVKKRYIYIWCAVSNLWKRGRMDSDRTLDWLKNV